MKKPSCPVALLLLCVAPFLCGKVYAADGDVAIDFSIDMARTELAFANNTTEIDFQKINNFARTELPNANNSVAGIKLAHGNFTAADVNSHGGFLPYLLGSGEYFKLNIVADSILFGGGLALVAAELALANFKNDKNFNGTLYERGDVNKFDSWSMRPYSRALDITSNVTVGFAAASPLVLLATDMREWISIYTMYAETMLLAHVASTITKSLVFRPRPYMYFDGWPQADVDSGDWNNSFPSGHTTMAFAAASFAVFVFLNYFPDSAWSIAVAGGASALAISTAALRVASGNHFFSDVLVGAAIGTAIGIGVPLLHKIGVWKRRDGKNKRVAFALSPFGFQMCLRF